MKWIALCIGGLVLAVATESVVKLVAALAVGLAITAFALDGPGALAAFRERGAVAETLTRGVDEAERTLAEIERLGLDLGGVTGRLVEEGVASFVKSFDDLMNAIAAKRPTEA